MEASVVSVGNAAIVFKVLSTHDDDARLGRPALLLLPRQRKPLVSEVGRQFHETISAGIRKIKFDRVLVPGSQIMLHKVR